MCFYHNIFYSAIYWVKKKKNICLHMKKIVLESFRK